jgi:aryl-alcohol dehydrogenase-like predicted oxidoreductase
VRSVFYRDYFFANKGTAYKVHSKAYDYIVKLKKFSDYKGITLQQLAISFVKHYSLISYILIGYEGIEQLLNNVKDFNINITFSQQDLKFINKSFGAVEKNIIDSRQWECLKHLSQEMI